MHFVLVLAGIGVLGVLNAPGSETNLPLHAMHTIKGTNGILRFISEAAYEFAKLKSQMSKTPAFYTVYTNHWPTGLVPIFGVEKTNRFELRRRPARGLENTSDPLFFALPLAHETNAVLIAGRWECEATRGTGSRADLSWELSIETNMLAGRFDQGAEYRYADIRGGSFLSNQFNLRVEYTSDVYLLTGELHGDKLAGKWRRQDNNEDGVWTAVRPTPNGALLPPAKNLANLVEWRRGTERRYTTENVAPGPDWAPYPLCRVWRKPNLD